jgi:hypothetical protein
MSAGLVSRRGGQDRAAPGHGIGGLDFSVLTIDRIGQPNGSGPNGWPAALTFEGEFANVTRNRIAPCWCGTT